jgi:hypothetical protein
MNTENKIIFKNNVAVFYPFLSLRGYWGKELHVQPINSISGKCHIVFTSDYVTISTKLSDVTENVELTIFEGIPPRDEILSNMFCFAGAINVGNKGILLDFGSNSDVTISWVEGLTLVHIVLPFEECLNHQVQNIVCYLKTVEPKRARTSIGKIFQRG